MTARIVCYECGTSACRADCAELLGGGAPMLYEHDQHQLCVMHPASGYYALAGRVDVECAREEEIRTAFTTSFLRTHDTRMRTVGKFPRGQALGITDGIHGPRHFGDAETSPEALRWLAAVTKTLDVYVTLPSIDQYFCDLQAMWRAG